MKRAICLILVLLALTSCEDRPTERTCEQDNLPTNYEIIYIEGMPCVYIEKQVCAGYSAPAITCDWSKWEGEQ